MSTFLLNVLPLNRNFGDAIAVQDLRGIYVEILFEVPPPRTKILEPLLLVMQSEKLGVKIDPTLGLQGLSVLYEIYHIRIQRTEYFSLKEIVSRAPHSLIFAFQWLHSAYTIQLHSVYLCTSILTHWSVLIPNIFDIP